VKIALVHSYYSSATPSGENIVVDMQVSALIEAGHDVKLVAARTDDLADRPLHKVRTSVNVVSGTGMSPLKEITEFEPDIVHVHNLFPNFSTKWLTKWSGPLIATMHNFRPICSNGLLFRDGRQCTLCPERGHHNAVIHACYRDSKLATLPIAMKNRNGINHDAVFSRAQRVVVLSERSRSTYEKYGASRDQLIVLPNFIDPPRLDINGNSDPKSWMYAGRLNPEKGIVDLLEKWPSHEQLIVAGTGIDESAVRDIATKRSNVTYLGAIPREKLLSKLPNVKGVVIPSLCAENLPTIYLEALAAGLPIVARSGNSAADDIDNWAPGLTYSNKNELLDAIYKATSNREKIRQMARMQFEEKYTRAAWLEGIENIYNKARLSFEQ
jgi:glycosyltransferase involved in cell wall biosynthesis